MMMCQPLQVGWMATVLIRRSHSEVLLPMSATSMMPWSMVLWPHPECIV